MFNCIALSLNDKRSVSCYFGAVFSDCGSHPGYSSLNSQHLLAAQSSSVSSGEALWFVALLTQLLGFLWHRGPVVCKGVTDTRLGLRCAAPAALSALGATDVVRAFFTQLCVNNELQVCILCCWVSASHPPQSPFALSIHPAGKILKMTLQSECFGHFLLLFTRLSPRGKNKSSAGVRNWCGC